MTFHLGLPQGLLVVLFLLSVALNIRDHGKPSSNTNAWRALCSAGGA